MTDSTFSPTDFLGAIRVGGADAELFLQGQLTQDVRLLGSEPRLAGYCSAKGRLLAVMQVRSNHESILLEVHRSVLEGTLKRLRMFVLRSRVTLDLAAAQPHERDENAWRLANIERGVPVIYPTTSDHFVPQMVNLDQLGGISFDKGCYTGQEIVARLHYRGNLKRRMFRTHCDAPAEPGAAVIESQGDTQTVGEVVDCAPLAGGGHALSAVLQLTHAESTTLRLGVPDGPALAKATPYFD